MMLNKGIFLQNTSTIILTRQHDKLSMTITAYKYKKINYFRYFPNTAMYHVHVMLRKISKFLNYKKNLNYNIYLHINSYPASPQPFTQLHLQFCQHFITSTFCGKKACLDLDQKCCQHLGHILCQLTGNQSLHLIIFFCSFNVAIYITNITNIYNDNLKL